MDIPKMRIHLNTIVLLLFSTSLLYAQVSKPTCDVANHLTGSVKLNALSDEVIKAACAQHEQDNKCEEVSEPPQKFNADDLANRLIAKDKMGKKLIAKLSAMAMAEDKSLTQKEIETKVKAKIVKFVKANQCIPALGDVNSSLDYDDFGGKAKFKNQNDRMKQEAELMKVSKDPVALQRFKEHQIKRNQETFYDFINKDNNDVEGKAFNPRFCSKAIILRQPAKTVFPNPRCVGSVSKYFVNNKAVLKEESESDRMADQAQITKCISENKEAGYVVKSVTINSSANQLRNTSSLEEIKSGEGFCGFDFQGLSAARNAFALKTILPGLITVDAKTPIKTNTAGENGNGTSGPCPYGKDGKLLPEYAGSKKNKLEDYKSTEIIIEFEPTNFLKSKQNADTTGTVRLGSNCEGFKIKCEGSY